MEESVWPTALSASTSRSPGSMFMSGPTAARAAAPAIARAGRAGAARAPAGAAADRHRGQRRLGRQRRVGLAEAGCR